MLECVGKSRCRRSEVQFFSSSKNKEINRGTTYCILRITQGSPSGCGRPEIPGVSQVEKGEHRRSYTSYIYFGMSLRVQDRIPLCIAAPPVMTFGALNNLSRGDIQRIPVVKWVTCLGFDKAYHRGVYYRRCDIFGVVDGKEFGCYTPSR